MIDLKLAHTGVIRINMLCARQTCARLDASNVNWRNGKRFSYCCYFGRSWLYDWQVSTQNKMKDDHTTNSLTRNSHWRHSCSVACITYRQTYDDRLPNWRTSDRASAFLIKGSTISMWTKVKHTHRHTRHMCTCRTPKSAPASSHNCDNYALARTQTAKICKTRRQVAAAHQRAFRTSQFVVFLRHRRFFCFAHNCTGRWTKPHASIIGSRTIMSRTRDYDDDDASEVHFVAF